jgi:hypothetical protein
VEIPSEPEPDSVLQTSYGSPSVFRTPVRGLQDSASGTSMLGSPFSPQKRYDLTYGGNPDTQPIRSYEIAFLVRIFNQICSNINEKVFVFKGKKLAKLIETTFYVCLVRTRAGTVVRSTWFRRARRSAVIGSADYLSRGGETLRNSEKYPEALRSACVSSEACKPTGGRLRVGRFHFGIFFWMAPRDSVAVAGILCVCCYICSSFFRDLARIWWPYFYRCRRFLCRSLLNSSFVTV